MARKRFVFLRTVESILKHAQLGADRRAFKRRVLILFLVGILFTVGVSPVRSQMPVGNPIVQSFADVRQLVQQGKANYDAGQFRQAVENLQQAANAFAIKGDKLKQAIILSNLSLAYQQLGEWAEAEKAIADSLNLLGVNPQAMQTERIPDVSTQQLRILAPALDIHGRLWYKQGKSEVALSSWRQAANIYQKLGFQEGIIGSQINQVQALQALGLYQQARATIQQVQQNLEQLPESLQTTGLRSLGDLLRAVGDLKNSQHFLEESLKIAKNLNSPQDISAAWLSLGNTYFALGNLERDRQESAREYQFMPWRCVKSIPPDSALKFYEDAERAYQRVIDELPSKNTYIQVQINRLNLLVETEQLPAAQKVWHEIDLSSLPKSRTAVYAQINYARNLACLRQKLSISTNVPSWQEIDNLLYKAVRDAEKLEDRRAKSYALGNRGGLYEYLGWQNQQNQQALQTAQRLTEEALFLAQPSEAPSAAYQWQWQLGRLFEDGGERDKAIAAYQSAVETLRTVRSDLLAINSDVQFSFRDNVEPVYRQLVDLLLRTEGTSEPSPKNLAPAIDLIDSLQLAELENFLRCNLSPFAPNQEGIDKVDPHAAFIYPIILEDRLEVIFKLPGQPLKHHVNPIKRTDVKKNLEELREDILYRRVKEVREKSKQVYSWLIKPLEEDLKNSSEVETLVFVLDGYLRNIPMAVLYDEQAKEYLIEKKYALALLPSSQLFDLKPLPSQLSVLAAGVSEKLEVENQVFSALNAREEVEQIENVVSTKKLLNSQFTKKNLQQQVNSGAFSVVHMATHGKFSSDPEDTYILAYNELLKAKELDILLQSSTQEASGTIELLVLSACDTAKGDNRATLGLAGVAVRAGARSTLATLWPVSDESTVELMKQFYKEWKKPGVTKAEALHRAQKFLFNERINSRSYKNPYYWAPYVLVGNWR